MEKISSAHTLDQATRANLVKTARLIITRMIQFLNYAQRPDRQAEMQLYAILNINYAHKTFKQVLDTK